MRRLTLFLLLIISLGTIPAWGQVTEADLSSLKARLDVLEAQNQQLRSELESRAAAPQQILLTDDAQTVGTSLPAPPGSAPFAPTDEQIRSVVEEYMAAHAAHVNAAAAANAEAKSGDPAWAEVGKDLSMTASWNNGFEAATKDKAFRVHIGGRYQFDVGWFDADPNVQNNINVPYADGADFRRARLRIDGTMYEVIDWACEYDFINSARLRNAAGTGATDIAVTAPTDLWWTFTHLPVVGNLRIGNQKEGIGFEHIVSSRFQPFMERSYNQDTFYGGAFNGFLPGAQFINTYDDEMGVWQLGIFKPANSVFAYNTGNGDYSVTGRITRLLWYEDEGRQLFHIGASARQATAVGQNNYLGRQITFRTRDAIRTGLSVHWPTPANTGTLFGDDMQWINVELAGVRGPWTFQAEWLVSGLQDARTTLNGPLGNTVTYHGGYVQLLYFLTGESDHYNRKTGAFDRVKPFENYFFVEGDDCCRHFGRGAWQVGARYNYLDLNDNGINGGILHNMSYTLNWFLNPNMKVQFDYISTYRDAPLAAGAGDGWINGWGMRFAHDF
jgi:phosphate-selective porin OprO/OprP